jgi:hypothetical protein
MGSILSKKKQDITSKSRNNLRSLQSRRRSIFIRDENPEQETINALNDLASSLIADIYGLDGQQAELEDVLETTTKSLKEAIEAGNPVAVAVLNNSAQECEIAISNIVQKRLHLETELYEVEAKKFDIEDGEYSAKLCSAIDSSQKIGFPLLAVRFTWLSTLQSTLLIQYPEMTSSDFTMTFLSAVYVQDVTKQSGLSLCDHFISEGEGRMVGLATHYVVYAQSMLLCDFKDTLENLFLQKGVPLDAQEKIFIWVDIFSFTQEAIMFQSLHIGPEWYHDMLAPALRCIANAIVVFDHKKGNPVLKSSWALMEIYLTSVDSGVQVEIAMSKINAKSFIDDATTKGIRKVFPKTDKLENSKCSILGKKDHIMDAASALTTSASSFDDIVKSETESLMSKYLNALLQWCRDVKDVPYTSLVASVIGDFCQVHLYYEESEQSFKYALKLARNAYGNLDPRTVRIVKKMIKLYEATSAFEKAEDLRQFGKPNRDKGGSDLVTLKGADVQVISNKSGDD